MKSLVLPLVFAAIGISELSAANHPSRDWKAHPAVVEASTSSRIYAIGDPHSDYARFTTVLVATKIIASAPSNPSQVQWTAGNAVVVLTGDMIDKGPDAIKVIQLVQAMQSAAKTAGGQFIVTMGNHEAEFLANYKGSKTKEFHDALKAAGIQPSSVANCEGSIGQFLCGLPFGAKVNDWFFSHGGNSAGRSIQKLSSDIENGYAKDGYATPELIGDNSILEARLNDKGPNGLPWFYNGDKKTDVPALLQKYAQALGVAHILQGHQPGYVKFPKNERADYDLFQNYGVFFLNDGGMSAGVSGNASSGGAMIINSQSVTAVCPNGTTKVLWDTTNPSTNTIHCNVSR